jgi:hypothetical protein
MIEVEIVERTEGRVVARARVTFEGQTAEATVARADEIRAHQAAIYQARDELIERSYTPELKAEAQSRRPKGTPLSPALAELTAGHRRLVNECFEAMPDSPPPGRTA